MKTVKKKKIVGKFQIFGKAEVRKFDLMQTEQNTDIYSATH